MGESENRGQEEERKGWWGSTLGKLKTALSKTKSQIVGSVGGDEQPEYEDAAEQGGHYQGGAVADAAVSGSYHSTAGGAHVTAGGAHDDTAGGLAQSGPSETGANIPAGAAPAFTPVPNLSSAPAKAPAQTAAPSTLPTPIAQLEASKTAAPAATAPGAKPAIVPVDEEYLEDLEEKLIKTDIGLANAETLVDHLRKQAKGKDWAVNDVLKFLRQEFQSILKSAPEPGLKYIPGKVNIYLVVGVNGTGKTTSIGKLAWRFKQEGKKVLMAAGDTFRAAAESQLEIWSQRAGVDIVRLEDGADPGAVVFNAIAKAKEESYDAVVIDTAGRLHNKANLMAELKKVRGVIDK